MTLEDYHKVPVSMARPLGMASVPEEPGDKPIVLGSGSAKAKARSNGVVPGFMRDHRTDDEGFDREGPCGELAVATAAVVRQVRDIYIPRKRGKWSNYRNALEALLASESGDTTKIAFLTGKTIDETRLELHGLEVAGLIKAEIGSRANLVYSLVRSTEK